LIDQANLVITGPDLWGHASGGSKKEAKSTGTIQSSKNSIVTVSEIHLAFWNHEYINVQGTLAWQPMGGHAPWKILKIKLSKMNLRVFSATHSAARVTLAPLPSK